MPPLLLLLVALRLDESANREDRKQDTRKHPQGDVKQRRARVVGETAEKDRARALELDEIAKATSDDWKRQALMSVAKRWRDWADEIERFEVDRSDG